MSATIREINELLKEAKLSVTVSSEPRGRWVAWLTYGGSSIPFRGSGSSPGAALKSAFSSWARTDTSRVMELSPRGIAILRKVVGR